MSQNLDIQEFVIAIAVRQQNPTVLTADFLKYSGIIPSDWELARPPVLTNAAAQVVFQNGVSIIAEVNRIVFSELIANKEAQDVSIPVIARKYVETLTQVSYQGVSINFRGYVLFEQKNGTPRNYIFGNLLKPGPWQEFGTSPVQAALRFIYTLKEAQLFLDVNEVGLQLPDKSLLPAILFSANVSHTIAQDDPVQRLTNLVQVIGNWQKDLEIYKEVVNTKFLTTGSYQINLAPDEPLIFPKEAI
ncbi:MAG: hypothetical protein RMX68_026915 [Aulosira sp. ZfuVER01]|nr:hypothetical protein [Aulosira sp. ZfuVER01]MDZ8000184.1 hypothetical protein [Aulosira sp. DedVER01a]MDZ8055692.1 hypothetical protein [Aulosira sp. ZfuCHP01]